MSDIREQIDSAQTDLDRTTMPHFFRVERQNFINTMEKLLAVYEAAEKGIGVWYPIYTEHCDLHDELEAAIAAVNE